ncbi:putative T7SS-secreted protein [Nocardia sp. NPDC020380]|uniref:putative T7SS-secreted protein n=1 Tax=Nocardia sp. NPDC020380 TaxID=3364309 RepID=UPI0037962634
MGIGDWFNKVGDAVENAVDEVETKAGSVIDRGAHTVADFARDHGAGGVADAIDEIGDQISNALGGEIVEKELGQTKDKTELIHGEPSAIHDVSGKLKSMSTSIESTGDALRKIDVADWTGKAATAFHTEFDKQPKMWWTAGDAFVKAAAHLDSWYWAVTTAQAKAQEAIDKWEAAEKEEKSKKSAWNGLSDKEKKATPLVDTWTSMRDEARGILKNARSQRDSIASQVVSGLQTETQEAPTEPPLSQRLSADLSDLKDVYDYGKLSFGNGLLTSFSSIVQFARSTNALDPYNISHPAEYASSMADLGTGIVTAAADPGAVVDAVLTDARKNPFETGGAITGNIILTVMTGGAGTAPKVAAETVEEATNAVRLTEVTTNVLKDAPAGVPKGPPHVETPSLPGRAAPSVERPVDPSAGSGNPAATKPNGAQPGASAPQSPGTGLPKPDASAPAPAAAPEGGPAAGPHPDGAAPQPHPSDTHPGATEPATPQSHPDTPAHPDSTTAQPNPSTEPKPVEANHDPSSAGPHADHPGQPGLATDQPGQPGLATDRVPGDGSGSPHQQPENLRTNPEPERSQPNPDSGGPHQDKPGDTQQEHPREQVQPGQPHPNAETPDTPHSPTDGQQPAVEHDPAAHPGDPSETHPGGRDPQPDHGTPSHEHQPEPGPDGHHPTLEDHAGADQQAPDHARGGDPEDTSDLKDKYCTDDPVDIATGAFLLPETDVDLPGVLGLALRRTHRSSYGFGRWFGPSWSATLDMRLIIDDQGATFLQEDGVMLAFPHAAVEDSVEPVAGIRGWTLTRAEVGSYRVWDPKRELHFHFAPEPVLHGLDSRLGNLAISAITDRHNNRVRFHYDHDGTPTAVTHSGGYRVEIDTSGGRVAALTVVGTGDDGHEIRTRVREFSYERGHLVAVRNAVAAITRYTYDDDARMLSWTDSNGSSMVNAYDQAGRVVRQRGSAGVLNCDLEYVNFPDGTGRLTTLTDSVGGMITHGFDHDLRLRDVVDPAGGHTHIDYNTAREPLKVVAPDGATTHYQYTDDGDLAQVTRPDGEAVTVEYQKRNRPTAIHDAEGNVRRQEWSTAGNLSAITDAAGARTTYTYHPNGAVASILAPTGSRILVQVNAAGLPVEVTDPCGAVTRIDRDLFGRPIRITDPLGAVVLQEWATDGKLLRRTDADGHTESWSWDGEGNLLTHTDRAGGVTRFTYGAFDVLESVTDPGGSITRYRWDSERRLIAVTNPLGGIWTYKYDAAGRVIAETDYTGSTTRYTHDRGGRVTAVTPATGIARQQRYDILGRLTEITADTGEWIRHTYDRIGRVTTATSGIGEDPTHTLEFAYTPTGQLASQRLDDQDEMRHEYDLSSRRLRRTTPGGAVTAWGYDGFGNVRRLRADGGDIDFTYDSTGRATGWRIGEIGVQQSLSAAGRITAREVTAFPVSSLNLGFESANRPDTQMIRRDEYSYRADGYLNSHALDRSSMARENLDYTLDPIGRVTTVARDGRLSETYSYDALSNILSNSTSSSSVIGAIPTGSATSVVHKQDSTFGEKREYRNNLLVRDGRTRYHYDVAGRLIRKTVTRLSRKPSVWHYGYNAFDQLTDVTTPDGQRWRYTYDALGRRTTKQRLADDGGILERTDYIWDGNHLIEQAVDQTVTRWQYQPNSHTPITQTTDQELVDREFYALITDLVGTPVEIADPAAGTTAATASTDLWGNAHWSGKTSTPLRFPGQIHDPETGLHYNVNRYYDPSTGRYLTCDPLGLAPAPNPNSYPHNPTVWSDPLGLIPRSCDPRYKPGTAHGGENLPHIQPGEQWLRGTDGNAGWVPGQVADALRGRTFDDFNQFREAFWREVSNHPELANQFSPGNQVLMANGRAPFVVDSQSVGGATRYNLHHVNPIHNGGGVYDLDNLAVVTPRFHAEVLDPDFHYNR